MQNFTKRKNKNKIILMILVFLSVMIFTAHAEKMPGLTEIELTVVDEEATLYGTFQSHNQKVVSNENGIFMTHIRSRNEAFTAQQWRLSRSIDDGKSFSTIYEATHGTNPPILETDENNNIYLIRPDHNDGNAYLYRFMAEDDYIEPIISTIPSGNAGKYCMMYDSARQRLYYFAWGLTFYIIALDGTIIHSEILTASGDNAMPQYPHFSLDGEGILHTAWTTQKHGEYLYWDIHYMASPDGGISWQKMDGTFLNIPVKVDNTGPTDGISLDDEFEVHSWLSNFIAKDGKIHFVYNAQTPKNRQHYMRFDAKTGTREIDIQPEFSGTDISIRGQSGYFATRATLPNAPLYCLSWVTGGKIGCLASDDNGETWYDYAVSIGSFRTTYAIGGCREITDDGYIIGSFTDLAELPRVYFLKLKAGLSQAQIVNSEFDNGTFTVQFTYIHGQPENIRFSADGQAWSKWGDFSGNMMVRLSEVPKFYQLKSRMGVKSNVFKIHLSTTVE